MPKIYKDKICGYQLEYTLVGTKIGIKREDETNFQYLDLQLVGLDFKWDGTKLGIKKGSDTEYQFLDVGGASLEYNWNGYELGVRQEGETNYTYQNLRGASIEYDWQGTKLGVKTTDEDNYTYKDLKGDQGDPNVLTIGSVNIVAHDKGKITITGTAPSQILNMDLPMAPPTTFTVGTVGEAEEFAVNITGTAPNQKLNFLLKRGNDLEFKWNGTKLGVRVKGSTEYVYTDLKGEMGEVSKEQLDSAINDLRDEVDEKIGNIDLSNISSVPYGSISYYLAKAALPEGYIAEDGPQLEASKYPHLVSLLGTTNLKIGSLELNLTSNTSDSGFMIEYNGTPSVGLSTDYYYMFDGNLNTSYSFGNATGSTSVNLKLSGEKAKTIKKYFDKLNPIQIRIKGTYTNNDTRYPRQPSLNFLGSGGSIKEGNWIAAIGETIDFNVLLEMAQNVWSINSNEYIDLNWDVYSGVVNIHEIEFMNVPVESENLYIDIPATFTPVIAAGGDASRPNDDIISIMYVGG